MGGSSFKEDEVQVQKDREIDRDKVIRIEVGFLCSQTRDPIGPKLSSISVLFQNSFFVSFLALFFLAKVQF